MFHASSPAANRILKALFVHEVKCRTVSSVGVAVQTSSFSLPFPFVCFSLLVWGLCFQLADQITRGYAVCSLTSMWLLFLSLEETVK